MKLDKAVITLFVLLLTSSIEAIETATPNDVVDYRKDAIALTHATIYQTSEKVLTDATLYIADGQIIDVVGNREIREGYFEIDMLGKTIYPGLIDIYTEYGLSPVKIGPPQKWGSKENMMSTNLAASGANEAIKSHYAAALEWQPDLDTAEEFRKLGFSSVLSFKKDGVARGTSTLTTLGLELAGDAIISESAAAHYSFDKGTSKQHFPRSRMGMVALLRQTYLDAEWYEDQSQPPYHDLSLSAWNKTQKLPQIFETTSWNSALVADRLGDEFGVQYLIKGTGDEYQRIDLLKSTGASFIIPVNFSDPPLPELLGKTTLAQLKHWELAPYNLSMMAKADIPFAITSFGVEKNFWKKIKLAVKNGLDKGVALSSLTSKPAELISQTQHIGSLKNGLMANFIVTSGELFDEETIIEENWIRGKRFVINQIPEGPRGLYRLKLNEEAYEVEIYGKAPLLKARFVEKNQAQGTEKEKESKERPIGLKINEDHISLHFILDKDRAHQISGWRVKSGFRGHTQKDNGEWIDWELSFLENLSLVESGPIPSDSLTADGKPSNEASSNPPGKVIYPFVAYGEESLAQAEDFLIQNATVWTNEIEGVLLNTDVLIRDGNIRKVGKNLKSENVKTVDGTGLHLTSGIIDEHSHIALSGINDVASNSSMVRMKDVINSDDINIYRNLAGGVTASQLLHGSANPIGGQSAMVKLRWGVSPEEMLVSGAVGFNKFALGENVKRSRSPTSIRYPQTRMGVEQVFMDAFGQARQYGLEREKYRRLSTLQKRKTVKPRRNLVDETMLEILEGTRLVTSHSYVQSEINMLMKVAEAYDFRINTFTHILEGYKVADKMAAHGVGASTFSDWWGYKWEVRYAIPYNAALMIQAGVTTAINSDDAEMSRRLNQEAAKIIRYGGLSEEEAWKLVTLNPAKLLHLDHRMGSIKEGKDADLVLWSDNPLSIYARVQTTYVDGIAYYDKEKDQLMQMAVREERKRIIKKINRASLQNANRSKKEGGEKK